MDVRRPLIFCCVLVLSLIAGCRQNHAARELLERELRLQEDRIYELEAELEDAHRALCAIKQSPGGGEMRDRSPVTPNETPRTFAPPGSSLAPPTSTLGPPTVDLAPPSVELPPPGAATPGPAPKFQGPPAIVPPSVDLPEGIPGRALPPPSSTKPDAGGAAVPFKPMSSPKFLSPSVKANPVFDFPPSTATAAARPVAPPSSTSSPTPASPTSADARIKTAALGRATRGVNLDDRPGDDGVLVVVEARNARGEAVAPAAGVSLVLIDPAIAGEGGRYARWDFSADDTAALFRPANGDAAAGSYFELAWPDAPPAHARLKLFVRLTTSDGKQIQLDRDVTVDVVGGTSQLGAPPAFMPPQFVAPSTGEPSSPPIVPAAAQGEAAAEGGLRWGRRDAEPSAAVFASPATVTPSAVEMPSAVVPPEMALPVSASAEPASATIDRIETPAPLETPTGPLLFPADASLGAPEMLPRR